MKKVIVSVSNDLTTDQRVAKVCNSLHQNGYKVTLIGRKLKNSKPIDRNYTTKRLSLLFNKGVLFYAELNIRLFFILLFSKKDIVLSNDIDTLLPNFLISKLQSKEIVFDSHELFSEIPELINRPHIKKVWVTLEKLIIPKLKNCYTVSNSIASHFENLYNTKFNVIRNFSLQNKGINYPKKIFPENKKVIIYQGAVNIGRGLELMIETIPLLENTIFAIIGDGDIYDKLKLTVKSKKLDKKVVFLGRLTPKELTEVTPSATIGISFEEDLGLNYRYALPNKIFDYIQAEVPVLVSDLPEMKLIINDYNVGEVILDRNPFSLAKQINEMFNKDFTDSLKQAKNNLIWQNEEVTLLKIFNTLE